MPKINVDMPLDVRKYVMRSQTEMKIKKGVSQYSLQLTIFNLIREHEQFMKDKNSVK